MKKYIAGARANTQPTASVLCAVSKPGQSSNLRTVRGTHGTGPYKRVDCEYVLRFYGSTVVLMCNNRRDSHFMGS